MHVELNNSKSAFLKRDLKIMAWNASVQRAGLYNTQASEKARQQFRERVWQIIEQELIPEYHTPVNEKQHKDQICYLKQKTEEVTDPHVLGEGGYKIGIAPKPDEVRYGLHQ